jgi:hypothetical protein
MKKYILVLTISFVLSVKAFSADFEITPIVFDLLGVTAENETIVAYGNYGSILISNDNAVTWNQKRIFKKGIVLNVFINMDDIVAFNDLGEMSISYNKGIDWIGVQDLKDSVVAVIKYSDGYFVRSRNKVLTLTKEFQLNNQFPILSKKIIPVNDYDKTNYGRSIVYYKNNLIVESDSSCFIRFDKNLKPIDSLSFNKILYDSNFKYSTGYYLDADSKYLYIRAIGLKKSGTHISLESNIYWTEDFKTISNPIYPLALKGIMTLYKRYNDKSYVLNKTEKCFVDNTKLVSTGLTSYLNEFTIHNNKQIVVGDRKLLEILDLQDSTLNVVSNFIEYSSVIMPEKIDDGYLFYSGYSNYYRPYIYKTDNNVASLQPVVDKTDPKYTSFFRSNEYRFKIFDSKGKKLYFGGINPILGTAGYLWSSDDYGKSFTSKIIDKFYFNPIISAGLYLNAKQTTNLQMRGDNFITSNGYQSGIVDGKSVVYSYIYTFAKDFKVISYLYDTDIAIDYVYSSDTNSFLIHCANTLDSTSEIRYTSDKGKNWDIIKKYSLTEKKAYYKEITIGNNNYLALVHNTITVSDTSWKLDFVNLDNKEFGRICEWKATKLRPEYGDYGIGIDSDTNMIYISFLDTLYYVKDIFDRSTWQYYIVPNDGRMVYPIKKYGDKFFCRYKDDNIPWNAIMFWVKPSGTMSKVDENTTNEENYLYTYPPFPNPASKNIRSLVYWDTSSDIEQDEIGVYNIYGAKVSDRSKISFDKLNLYSGYLIWDCSGVETGVYMIVIKHGTATRTIKVVVN